jgi:acetoin utilization deacetylase AcuC-like enzyme
MINDIAVAIRVMQMRGRIRRAMTVDCDVHQGNGTAAIFAGSASKSNVLPSSSAPVLGTAASANSSQGHAKDVFTVSLHQEHNYPYVKPASSIDVNLPDGCGDAEYLAWLDNALSSGLRQFDPEFICYVAGADPFSEDQLGGLKLSIEGLKQRDELVFRAARARNIPIMTTYAGGYANRVEDTVTIHCNTVMAAMELYRSSPSAAS